MENCKHRVGFVGLGYCCGYNTEYTSFGSMPSCNEQNCHLGLKELESYIDGERRR